jgi:UDP-glucose:(heptosyl)LPS alpha-1,3-glucosyltransferase
MPGLDAYYCADPCYEDKARTLRGPIYRLSGRYRHFAAYERAVFAPQRSHRDPDDLRRAAAAVRKALRHAGGATSTCCRRASPPTGARRRMPPISAATFAAEFASRRRRSAAGADRLRLQDQGPGPLLAALAALPAPLKQRTRLIAIGQDDPKPFVCPDARSSGSASRSRILKGRDDIPRFLLGADLLVHPAYNENTGTVLLEALVAGLPVLTTAACGYAHYIEEAGAGRVVAAALRPGRLQRHRWPAMLADDAHGGSGAPTGSPSPNRPTSTACPSGLPT